MGLARCQRRVEVVDSSYKHSMVLAYAGSLPPLPLMKFIFPSISLPVGALVYTADGNVGMVLLR